MAIKMRVLTFLSLLAMSAALAGCSHSQNNSSQTRSSSHNSSVTTISTNSTTVQKGTLPKDGTIASKKVITTYQSYTGSDVKLYQIFYWTHGIKVEAYLTEPSKSGQYPLFVNLHGGYAWLAGWSSFGYTAKTVASLVNPNMVMLYPEYEGYMQSQGMIHGMKNDTLDIQNGIKAAKLLGEVKPNDTYVLGYSLGGGLALMTAAADHEVKAVVAVSPFVGLNEFVPWAKKSAKPDSIFYSQLRDIEASYGSHQVDSEAYNERSPDISSIQAPVLLLQGTADQHVAWQTVQMFYQQMKSANKVVKLVLYPGGHHGLHKSNSAASTQQIKGWFSKYGLSLDMQN